MMIFFPMDFQQLWTYGNIVLSSYEKKIKRFDDEKINKIYGNR